MVSTATHVPLLEPALAVLSWAAHTLVLRRELLSAGGLRNRDVASVWISAVCGDTISIDAIAIDAIDVHTVDANTIDINTVAVVARRRED